MGPTELVYLVGAALGGGGVATVIVAWVRRPVDQAEVEERIANARKVEADTRKTDMDNLRGIITELRTSGQAKDERLLRVEKRLDVLEERERHMLTRAAVHEAWDQMAFAMLISQNPGHPPPPPLVDRPALPSSDSGG